MKTPVFLGTATALITPFRNQKVDLSAFEQLIDMQLEAQIPALVVCGTTGEASTLSDDEKVMLFEHAVRYANGRTKTIAGIGTNDTEKSVRLAKRAQDCGAEALLAVTPYYNKCTQEGLISHYFSICEATNLPVIVYNVPSRTGLNLLPETWAELSEHPQINGLKEASGNMSQIAKSIHGAENGSVIWSGNDDQIVPVMALGGKGVISVLSNIRPNAVKMLTDACLCGDYKTAADLQLKYLSLIDALFSEVNPIPVKAALEKMGICADESRLPLTRMSAGKREKLYAVLDELGEETNYF